MENNENKLTVSVELTQEQYDFLVGQQKSHENELGIDVPVSALVRKAVDGAMKAAQRPERSSFGDRPERRDGPSGGRPPFGARPSFGGGRPSFGDRPSGGRPSFGDRGDRGGDRGGRPSFGGGRPSFGGGRPSFGGDRPSHGPKFDMTGAGHKTKSFGDK